MLQICTFHPLEWKENYGSICWRACLAWPFLEQRIQIWIVHAPFTPKQEDTRTNAWPMTTKILTCLWQVSTLSAHRGLLFPGRRTRQEGSVLKCSSPVKLRDRLKNVWSTFIAPNAITSESFVRWRISSWHIIIVCWTQSYTWLFICSQHHGVLIFKQISKENMKYLLGQKNPSLRIT